jgi:hypothetical protein
MVAGHSNSYIESLFQTEMQLYLPATLTSTQLILNEVITFKTSDPYCKIQKLSSYVLTLGTLTTTQSLVKLVSNPTTRNSSDSFDPVLDFTISSNSLPIILLAAETTGISGQYIQSLLNFKVISNVCSLMITITTGLQSISTMIGSAS